MNTKKAIEKLRSSITADQRKWLEVIYNLVKKGESPDYRKIRTFIYKELSREFNPSEINIYLTGHYRGEDITLLGIEIIDPERRLMSKTNTVIKSIKEILLENPKKKEVTSDEISILTNLAKEDISLILRLAGRYMRLYDGAASNGIDYGWSSIKIDDPQTFDEYIYFDSIEKKIEERIKNDEEYELKQKSLKEENELKPTRKTFNNVIGYDPIFRSRAERVDLGMCFVLMPFTESWSRRVYEDLIRENIEPLGVQCYRADSLSGQIIMEDIWLKINQAAFIVADVTGKNPNVMYEMGIVHSIGKPNILITQDIDGIPFDFTHLRHHEYQDNTDGFRDFGRKVQELVYDIYSKHYPNTNLRKKE